MNPHSLFARLVPSEFRPLLSCVSPNAFRVLEWKKVLAHAPTLAKRIASGEGVDALKRQLNGIFATDLELVDDNDPRWVDASTLSQEHGSFILKLYFTQFQSEYGLFLDLRPSHFRCSVDSSPQQARILWNPNGFWTRLNPEFRQGMYAIYSGYYGNQPKLLRRGLQQVGLVKDDFSEDRIARVEAMILAHIGGDASNQSFRISHYTQSFEKLFQFLIQEKIVLPQDFLYLGIYLASLYLHLESLGGSYNVGQIYRESMTVKTQPAGF